MVSRKGCSCVSEFLRLRDLDCLANTIGFSLGNLDNVSDAL